MSKPSVTVLIATFNRAERLRQTLEGLGRMSVPPGVDWELLVVDNNSTDRTHAVVEQYSGVPSCKVRYLFEPTQGKAHAVNAGLSAARGDIIALFDDDVIPATDWFTRVWEEFSADKELGALSFRVELANPEDLPLMIVTDTARRVARSCEDLIGLFAGVVVLRRSVLDDVGSFDTLLGPGAAFRAAVDIDHDYRIWKAGWKMLYAPSVLAFHNHGRRTKEAESALLRAYNIGRGAFYAKHILSGDMVAAKLMYWTIGSRIRQFLCGKNMMWVCRTSAWLLSGFVGYAAYRCWEWVRDHYLAVDKPRPTHV
jgi:glycosyltransferase involved in cell wall biosynthesis